MYRLFYIIIISLILGIYSCNNTELPIVGTTELSEDTLEIVADTVIEISVIDTNLRMFATNQLSEYDIINEDKGDKLFVLEKSDYKNSQYLYLKKQTTINYGDVEGIYPKLNLYLYSYTDSVVCTNAFAEWLKSIGDDDKIKPMENKDAVKTPPIFALKTSNKIFVLYYLCEHQENNWQEVKTKMKEYFEGKKYTIMNIECGGPLTWN